MTGDLSAPGGLHAAVLALSSGLEPGSPRAEALPWSRPRSHAALARHRQASTRGLAVIQANGRSGRLTQMGNLVEVDDHRVARLVASVAGGLLVSLRGESSPATHDTLGDEGDRRSHDAIMRELAARRPGDAVLSEEAANDDTRLGASRVWVVDPLDGTREFQEGRTDWAVHIALVVRGVPVAGAVALPALGKLLTTLPAPLLPERNGGPIRMVVSRTRPPEVAQKIKEALGAEMVPMGSAGAKAGAVIRGSADLYVHAGGQYEWDSAAPVAIASAAGLHASRIDGSPLKYNQSDPWLPDLLICRSELAAAVLSITRGPRV